MADRADHLPLPTRDATDAPGAIPPRAIADHGVIGNMMTVALVGRDAAIDFLCWPCFDSPSLFAALLDPDRGGIFELSPDIANARVLQSYLPDSNVLQTRWLGEDSSAEIVDLMTSSKDDKGDIKDSPRLIRRVRVTRGRATFRLRCQPRFDYARSKPEVTIDGDAVRFSVPELPPIRLRGGVPFVPGDGEATAQFTLETDETRYFVLDDGIAAPLSDDEVERMIVATHRRWQAWAAQSSYRGRWRSAVTRSALLLKLLTSQEHGSIVAAGTFGLPEAAGGERNWDYRATWIRDASFTVYAFLRLGYRQEALAFTRWAADRAAQCNEGSLQVMYALDGGDMAEEQTLPHLAGHGGARPVRIGNAAADQLQLDIYGALLDSIYLTNKYGEAISHGAWSGVCRVVDYVCDNWRCADSGIWELRSQPQEHLHSRLMCWVAVDRAVRLAEKRSLSAPFAKWLEARNAISEDIWTNFWNEEAGHFVRNRDSRDLDGALLMMPLVRFIGATDPAWLATLDAIAAQLSDGGLVMRYDRKDGLDGKEGSFAACAFWYVECLARAGRVQEARANFETLLGYGNHLGLYAEEFDGRAQLLGNFPQALTHLALISAAYFLDRAIDEPTSHTWPA